MAFFTATIYWDLIIMLVVVSLVYSATRHDRWDRILKEAVGWMFRMAGFLGGLGLVLYVLSSRPHLWPYAAVVLGIGAAIYYALTSPYFKKKFLKPEASTQQPAPTVKQ